MSFNLKGKLAVVTPSLEEKPIEPSTLNSVPFTINVKESSSELKLISTCGQLKVSFRKLVAFKIASSALLDSFFGPTCTGVKLSLISLFSAIFISSAYLLSTSALVSVETGAVVAETPLSLASISTTFLYSSSL